MDNSAKNAELGQKPSHYLQQALTADQEALYRIVAEEHGETLLAALRNPALEEDHLLVLLQRRGLPEELFSALHAAKRVLEHYKVKFALVCHPEAPTHLAITLLPQLYLFDLLKVCLMPGSTQDQRVAAERTIIQRIPTQPLGNKLTLARRGTAALVEALLHEGEPRLVEACVDNPHLKEGVVYRFIASPVATADTISIIARSGRWKGRPNIRMAILKNPRTPDIWYTVFLPGLPPAAVTELLASPRLSAARKELVRQTRNCRR